MKKKPTTDPPASAAPTPAPDPLDDFAQRLDALDVAVARRTQQRADAVTARERAEQARTAAQEQRDTLRMRALADNDPDAKSAYTDAVRTYRTAADDVEEQAALIEQLSAELKRLATEQAALRREQALAANRAADQRNRERHAALLALVREQVAPLLRDYLAEIVESDKRLRVAGFDDSTANQVASAARTIGIEIREAIFLAAGGNKFFARGFERPASWERARIPIDPIDDGAAAMAALLRADAVEPAEHVEEVSA